MTLLTESRAAFVALQAPYVEPTEEPVIGLSIPHLPSGYIFTTTEFRQGTINGPSVKDQPKQGIIHIPFLDAD